MRIMPPRIITFHLPSICNDRLWEAFNVDLDAPDQHWKLEARPCTLIAHPCLIQQ